MPKINDYSQNQIAAPRGRVENTTGLENAGAMGKAMAGLGGVIEDIADVSYRRQAQSELSDLNAGFAEARAEWASRIDQEFADGTLDAEKINQDFQDYMFKMNEGVQTREGRNFFERQQARLGGFVLRNATKSQAVLAGAKAAASWRESINNDGNALMSDPSSFDNIYASQIEALDAQVEIGTIAAKDAEKLKLQTGAELSKAAIRGWADFGDEGPDIAEGELSSGTYDQYLTADQKTQMQGYIRQQRNANEIEKGRERAAEKRAQELASEAWQQENIEKLSKASLSTKSILKSPMSADDKIRWMRLADESVKSKTQNDPRVYNELSRRILLPEGDPKKINSIADLSPYVNRGISIQDAVQLSGYVDKTPDGQSLKSNRKALMDFADAKLVKKDPMTGVSDPDGERSMATFQVALQAAENQLRKEGKPISSLYDPSSKDYFGNQVGKYLKTPQEIFAAMAGRAAPSTPPESVAPGGNEKRRKQGESAADYLKRIGK